VKTLSVLSICLLALLLNASTVSAADNQSTTNSLGNVVETVEFHDTPIEDILRLLARQNDLNLIIGPDSLGSISLRFSGVTLGAALDAILRSKGFQYQIFENIMLVMKPDSLEKVRGLGRQTRLFKLKYTDARDVKSAIDTARVLSPYGNIAVFARQVAVEAVKASALRPGSDPTSAAQINVLDPVGSSGSPPEVEVGHPAGE